MSFEPRYTKEQKAAAVSASLDRGVEPYKRVCELAAAGQLTDHTGAKLKPFTMPPGTLRGEVRKEKKRRAGLVSSALTKLPHRDAIEDMRVRFIACVDAQLRFIESTAQAQPSKTDLARLRAVGGLIQYAAAMPDRNDAAPPKPGTKVNGSRTPTQRTELGDKLMAAINEGRETAPDAHTQHKSSGEQQTAALTQTQDEGATGDEGGLPGSLAHRLGAALNGQA